MICFYCEENSGSTKDHIIPRSRGGSNDFRNTIQCCKLCNTFKAFRMPDEFYQHLLEIQAGIIKCHPDYKGLNFKKIKRQLKFLMTMHIPKYKAYIYKDGRGKGAAINEPITFFDLNFKEKKHHISEFKDALQKPKL